ncbi:MAG: HAD family phosphatase [Bacteroidaceae bacterium]|nr:HAD family phosphatase [Bacteroidaceae bacterium]
MMKKISNRLVVATDLDGTLLHTDKSLSNFTCQTLIHLQEQGVRIIIASGRPVNGIAPIADLLQLDKFGGIVLAYNGAQIVDWSTRQLLYSKALPTSCIATLYAQAKANGLEILTYHGDFIVSEDCTHQYVLRSMRANKLKPMQVDDFVHTVQSLDIYKCMIVGNPDTIEQLEPQLQKQMENQIDVFRSEPFYLECVPLGIDKGSGLQQLFSPLASRSTLHASRSSLIAFGDALNDIPMLRFASTSIAMSNAVPELQSIATHITRSNDEDGVAHFLLENIQIE